MRTSDFSARSTSRASAPTLSAMEAISLMKQTEVARNALSACLDSSADSTLIHSIFAENGWNNCVTRRRSASVRARPTIRSGFVNTSIAFPSPSFRSSPRRVSPRPASTDSSCAVPPTGNCEEISTACPFRHAPGFARSGRKRMRRRRDPIHPPAVERDQNDVLARDGILSVWKMSSVPISALRRPSSRVRAPRLRDYRGSRPPMRFGSGSTLTTWCPPEARYAALTAPKRHIPATATFIGVTLFLYKFAGSSPRIVSRTIDRKFRILEGSRSREQLLPFGTAFPRDPAGVCGLHVGRARASE